MRRLKKFTSFFLFLLVLLLGFSFLSGFFKEDAVAWYSCLPDYCFNGWSKIYGIYYDGPDASCDGPMDLPYWCSGTDAVCEGESPPHVFLDSNCTEPATKGCCTSTNPDPCTCSWNTGVCGGGTCNDDERYQTQSCTPTTCDGNGDTRCTYDASCCTGCGCTPTCSGNYPLSSCSGPGCSNNNNGTCCTNVDSCGVACGGTTCTTCYACSPPSAPATPTSVSLRVDTTDYTLSPSSSDPTIIDYRNGGTIKVFSNAVSNSTTDYYKYDVYNAYTGGTSLLDYAGTTQIQPASESLAYSAIGRFEAKHYNFICPENTEQYSETRIGYYCMERNVKPPTTPTGMNLTIDGQTYALSTSAVEPKVVKYPTTNATETNTKLHVLPTRTTPATASASGYRVEANDYGLGEWMDFSCARGEDFCNEGESNEYNFSPNTEPLLNVLREGAEGKIDGKYYDVNECDTTKVYSDPEEFYYRVNNNPDFSCPNIINNEEDRTSTRNCTSTTYTGTEVNNPLKFEIIGGDADNVDEVKGAIVWLSKDGTFNNIPDFPTIAGTYAYSDPNHIAVMIKQKDGSWDNSPLIYTADSSNGYNWGNITEDREIKIEDGTETVVMATVTSASGTVNGGNVNFYIEITFHEVTSGQTVYPAGNYDVSGLVFDEHMLLASGTVVDQFYMATDCRAGGWNIDLIPPTFEDGSPTTKTIYSRVLGLLWNFNGTGSYASDAVINAYSYTETEDVILESPPGYTNITLSPPPPEAEIGIMGDNAWHLINSPVGESYDSNARINIGLNDDGTITFYVTGFDQACNYVVSDGSKTTINLNPWITSKGGLMYSEGNVGAAAKDYTAYSTFINSVLRKVTADELDIATEVVTSGSDTINDFIHPELEAVRANSVNNSNSQMSSWYEYFSNRLNEQMVKLGQSNFRLFGFPAGGISENKISDYCDREYCYMNIENAGGNPLYIVPEYTYRPVPDERRKELICDKKTLIMASGDIHIEPDIISGGDGNINGCIFVAGGNITVGAGDWVTQSKTTIEETRYDYLDAFLIADGIIDLQLVDVREEDEYGNETGSVIYTRDGLEIYGGLVAFGENIPYGTSAVQANRSFGLWNAYIPTTAITWDPRYAKLAEAFFGPTSGMYKREVGFKPY